MKFLFIHFDSKCTLFLTMTVLWFLFGKLSLISSQRTLSIITLTTYPLNSFWKILPCSLSSWNFYVRLQFLKINKVFEDYQLFKEQYTKRLDRLFLLNLFMCLAVKNKKTKSLNDFQAKVIWTIMKQIKFCWNVLIRVCHFFRKTHFPKTWRMKQARMILF